MVAKSNLSESFGEPRAHQEQSKVCFSALDRAIGRSCRDACRSTIFENDTCSHIFFRSKIRLCTRKNTTF